MGIGKKKRKGYEVSRLKRRHVSWINFPSSGSLDGGTPLSIILFVPEWRLQIPDPGDVI